MSTTSLITYYNSLFVYIISSKSVYILEFIIIDINRVNYLKIELEKY